MYGLELTPEHPVATLADLAVTAEAAGFDAVFASHHYNNRDQFLALADIARETDELLVGPGIANPYETHPVTLASRMATLDELSGGRGLFGVGPGDRSTLANLGYDQDGALRRTLETFKVAQRLWAGERVDHDRTVFVGLDRVLVELSVKVLGRQLEGVRFIIIRDTRTSDVVVAVVRTFRVEGVLSIGVRGELIFEGAVFSSARATVEATGRAKFVVIVGREAGDDDLLTLVVDVLCLTVDLVLDLTSIQGSGC
jgi:hypothetical protein